MKNKLQSIRNPLRLSCLWIPTGIPTGNLKQPLACVWVEARVARAASTTPAGSEVGGLCLCA